MQVAEKTAKVYGTRARAFVRFAVFYRYMLVLPATDKALATFVSFQSQSCTFDMIKGYLSGVVRPYGQWHRMIVRPYWL